MNFSRLSTQPKPTEGKYPHLVWYLELPSARKVAVSKYLLSYSYVPRVKYEIPAFRKPPSPYPVADAVPWAPTPIYQNSSDSGTSFACTHVCRQRSSRVDCPKSTDQWCFSFPSLYVSKLSKI